MFWDQIANKEILKLLNNWKIDMYCDNNYLFKISEKRVLEQYYIIKNQVDNSGFLNKLRILFFSCCMI